jgi:outer membrane protein TolC
MLPHALRPSLAAFGLCLAALTANAQPPAKKIVPMIPPAKQVPNVMPRLPEPAPAPFPAPVEGAPVVTRYTLGEALAIGHSRHPQLAALKASMNAALLKQRGLGEVKRTIGLFSPDIDIREQQSDLGLKAAMAEYEQAGHEVTYAVVRCYYTVVYAREQTKVARDLVEQLEANLDQVKKIVGGKGGKGGIGAITQNTVDTLSVVVGEARQKLVQAETGADRARAALREAMGLEPGTLVDVADEILPDISATIKREIVIAHAVTRRGEVHLAQIGADVTRLEICAQWARRLTLLGTTYANAGDIHARPIPSAQREPDYKPGAIGPEMPDRLLGGRDTRSKTAALYAERARAAAEQARSLVGLEAEVGYARWVESVRRVKDTREAAKAGRDLIDRLREAAGGVETKEQVLLNEVSAARAFAALNEALYDQIAALVNLERITAGGVRVNFKGRGVDK